MPSRRIGRIVFGTFFALDLLVAAWLVYAWSFHRNSLVTMKLAIFSTFVSEPALFDGSAGPAAIDEFRRDPEALVDRYAEQIADSFGTLDSLPQDIVPRAKSIAMSFSKNGGPGCGDPMPIVDKLGHLAAGNGNGCCSDHSEVFLALASVYGLQAREVTHARHATNEVFDPESKQWIYIDPQFAIMATDGRGKYLSLLDIRETFDRGEQPVYEFFGNQHHEFATKPAIEHKYYDTRDDFDLVMVTMGNNVFENDVFNETFAFVPKMLVQMIGFTVGPTPGYIVYSDPVIAEKYATLRFRFLAIASILTIGTLLYPLQVAIEFCRNR